MSLRISCRLLRLKLCRVKLYFRFACETEDFHFVLWNVCLFTFEGNIQYSKKVLRLAMEYADGDKIVYGRCRYFVLRRKQTSRITTHYAKNSHLITQLILITFAIYM